MTEHAAQDTFADVAGAGSALRDLLRGAQKPLVLTHAAADADAASSALSMAALCTALGTPPIGVTAGDAMIPDNLNFIPGSDQLVHYDAAALDALLDETDLLILVDCSDERRLGPLFYRHAENFARGRIVVNIDHHVSNTRFGNLNLVVPAAGSTAELMTVLYGELDIHIDTPLASILLAGIYGDTLGLRTPSTSANALRTAADLIERGADLDTIVDHLFRLKPYSSIQLWGLALSAAQWRGTLIWTLVTPEMLERTGAHRSEAEGIVNFLAGTLGARAAALIYEESWGYRVSMRTLAEDVDVAAILSRHNGGGHPRAAGARLETGPGSLEAFLADIEATLAGNAVPSLVTATAAVAS